MAGAMAVQRGQHVARRATHVQAAAQRARAPPCLRISAATFPRRPYPHPSPRRSGPAAAARPSAPEHAGAGSPPSSRRDGLPALALALAPSHPRTPISPAAAGKTTIADTLVASNGIISQRMAGQLRYMDDRPDEQKRGITMKSSAISLLHRHANEVHLVNVIDSPGHVDFSSEVSTAVRLSDGCVIVIDVVEGVSAQTYAVIRQAWSEQLRPVLVLNKIDRLITELQMSTFEAYLHLQEVLGSVNLITSALFAAQVAEDRADTDAKAKVASGKVAEAAAAEAAAAQGGAQGAAEAEAADGPGEVNFEDQVFDWSVEDKDDSDVYFDPTRGNVIFASAYDGWAFSVGQFAVLLAKKFNIPTKHKQLSKALWGDYYVTKEKGQRRVKKGAQVKGKPPLFVSAVLQTLWDIYESASKDSGTIYISGGYFS